MARNRPSWQAIARQIPPIAAIQSVAALIFLLLLSIYFVAGKGEGARIASLLVFTSTPALVAQYYALAILQGLGDLRWWNIYRMAPAAGYTLCLATGLYFRLTIVTCTLCWIISQVLSTVAVLRHVSIRYRGHREPHVATEPLPSQRAIARFGVAGFLAQVSPVETFRLDSLMIAAMFPSQIIGYYAVALSMSNAPRFIADGIVAVAYPHVSAQDDFQGRRSTKRYLIAALLLCGSATVVILITLPWVIPFLFGRQFSPAIDVSSVLVIAAGLISVRRVGSDCLRALGMPGASTAIEIITLLLLVPGFIVLGHWKNGRGIALALAISALSGLGLMMYLLRTPARS